VYSIGIVEYRKRNRLIIEAALEKNKRGKSVLIYVILIEHGERLVEIANLMGASPIFIRGSSDSELREETRQAINEKKILLTICTVAWSEGINIKTLDTIILAGGGKSEIALIQKIGRGLRRTDTKKTATIIDCLDQGKYISDHCVSRLNIYAENKWI
jgi:superfamily II DNA or RNA helicase